MRVALTGADLADAFRRVPENDSSHCRSSSANLPMESTRRRPLSPWPGRRIVAALDWRASY
ncbi:MAG: hypothetical protein QOG01_1147 [Pseudonocardiales bacterium]|jgi:hypothetical protein|nr:hypothetical protein [Pseudonocardiales bacterium]